MSIYTTIIDNYQQVLPETRFIFYVYAYIRKYEGTPYYIGKGCGNRAYAKRIAKRISTINSTNDFG